MAYQQDKNGKITISGFEKGIASSPHQGIANMQNVNIATESGEVMASFGRVQQSQASMSGTISVITTNQLVLTVGSSTSSILVGSWITVANVTGNLTGQLTSGNSYYVLDYNPSFGYKLSTGYANAAASAISGYTSGSATFTTAYGINLPIASAIETYTDAALSTQYRYYILDNDGYIYVQDTSANSVSGVAQPLWFLPTITPATNASGITVLNGWLFVFQGYTISAKPTVNLTVSFTAFAGGNALSVNKHFAISSKNGIIYYCDGCYVGSIFPNSAAVSGLTNIQSFCSYTTSTTTGTIAVTISGSVPSTGQAGSTSRVPAVFFAATGGSIPSALSTVGAYYWILYDTSAKTFKVYAAESGGSALDITTGASGTQYFNTFYPISGGVGFGTDLMVFSPQALNLPTVETSTSLLELDNTIIVGTTSNILYPWSQVGALPTDKIALPENGTYSMINVNNMGYIFAGNKGNIYITNGSTASAVITVPDYCAGIPGTASSYIEPYFVWGGTMYLKGRVYFSILDTTGAKAGNCGGIWSFIPTQNLFFGQDVGLSLRQENQSSYGTYNGDCPVLIPNQNQLAIAPQYFSAWYNTAAGAYGIDGTASYPVGISLIETDLIPTGTMLDKKTFKQIEYKLAAPLASGESIGIAWRKDGVSAYQSAGTISTESTQSLSGYVPANFEKTQWLQLQITLNPLTTSATSFCRLTEISIS